MPEEIDLTAGAALRIGETHVEIVSIHRDRVELAITFPEHITIKIPNPLTDGKN